MHSFWNLLLSPYIFLTNLRGYALQKSFETDFLNVPEVLNVHMNKIYKKLTTVK